MRRCCAVLLTICGYAFGGTYYITVAGLGGEPDYEARFVQQALEIQKLVSGEGVQVETLTGQKSTKPALQAALAKLASTAKPDDELILTLIGHGTYDGLVYKFNLVGPDVTADELRSWLDRIPARQLIVNMTSSSGASVAILRRENRVIISATRSGNERIATIFPRYWIEALRDSSADTDKNDSVSALEAFRFADQKTARFYETQKRVATEHALLEDTGKGDGVRAPAPDNGEGLVAARFAVVRMGAAQAALKDPAKQQLLSRKEDIEQRIDQLKYQKAAMPLNDYKQQLQALLLQLAEVQEQIEK